MRSPLHAVMLIGTLSCALASMGCPKSKPESTAAPTATVVPVLCLAQPPTGEVLAGSASSSAPGGPMGLHYMLTSGVYMVPAGGGPPQRLTKGLPQHDISALVATGANAWIAAGNGLYRSEDRGASWKQVNEAYMEFRSLIVTQSGRVLAGSEGKGILSSTDDGKTWVPSGPTSGTVLAFALHPRGRVYAAMPSGVVASDDDGETWTSIGMTKRGARSIVVTAGGDVLVGVTGTDVATKRMGIGGVMMGGMLEATGMSGGVFRCSNADCGLPEDKGDETKGKEKGSKTKGAPPKKSASTVDAGSAETDGGADAEAKDPWESLGPAKTTVWELVLMADGTVLAGTFSKGVMRLEGSAWQSSNAGLGESANVTALLVGKDGKVFAGTPGGLFASSDEGVSWKPVSLLPDEKKPPSK